MERHLRNGKGRFTIAKSILILLLCLTAFAVLLFTADYCRCWYMARAFSKQVPGGVIIATKDGYIVKLDPVFLAGLKAEDVEYGQVVYIRITGAISGKYKTKSNIEALDAPGYFLEMSRYAQVNPMTHLWYREKANTEIREIFASLTITKTMPFKVYCLRINPHKGFIKVERAAETTKLSLPENLFRDYGKLLDEQRQSS